MSINGADSDSDANPEHSGVNKESKKKKSKNNKDCNGDGVDTSNFTIEERLVAAVWVHERKFEKMSMSQIKINFRIRFNKPPPTKNTLYFWEKKIFATGKVMDVKRSGRPCTRKSFIPSVEASLKQSPGLSIRTRAEQLSLPRSTLRKILMEDIKFQSPKPQQQNNDADNGNHYPNKSNQETGENNKIEKPPVMEMPCTNLPPAPLPPPPPPPQPPPTSYSYSETFNTLPFTSMVSVHSKIETDMTKHINHNLNSHINLHQQHSQPMNHLNYVQTNHMQDVGMLNYQRKVDYQNINVKIEYH